MSLFVISDTHLSLNEKTEKPMDVFGRRWENHVERIEYFFRKEITEDDTVVIPGDISWAMSLAEAREDFLFLDSLPGKKLIGKGNHDYWWQTAKKIGEFFDENKIETIGLLYNNAHRVGDFAVYGTRGWYSEGTAPSGTDYEKLVAREALRLRASLEIGKSLGGERIVFLHFPPAFCDFVCRPIIDVLHEYDVRRLYFGHLHGQYSIPASYTFEDIEMSIVSADYLQFRPVKIG